MMSRYTSGALMICLLFATTAKAEDIKFCFKMYGDYSDAADADGDGTDDVGLRNGSPEDYWKSGPSAQYFRGGKYQIRLGSSGGALLASGYLGDGLGVGDTGLACSEVISLASVDQTYWYRIDSEVSVNGNKIVGKRDDTGGMCYRSTTYSHTDGPGTYAVTVGGNSEDCKDVFRALSASAFSLYRHNGGNSGVTFTVRTRGSCDNSSAGTTTCLSDSGANRKFTVSHEMGHALIYARDSSFNIGDCSFSDSKCPTEQGNHAMASQEHSSCALKEAFAHFYAADTYNNHGEDDCAFNYYKAYYPADPNLAQQMVDCEAASSDQSALESGTTPAWALYPRRTMETVSPPNFATAGCSTPWSGKSVEVDWLRVLWNMHTDGSSPPSFTAIVDWLTGAGIGTQTCFSQLDAEANSVGGTIDAYWDAHKSWHGVDN